MRSLTRRAIPAPLAATDIQVNLAAERAFELGPSFGKMSGRLAVLNVFDRVYELRDGSGIGVGAPQFGPRRTFVVGVTKTF
jgi:outer membrane receptor protein involved in Fe transport